MLTIEDWHLRYLKQSTWTAQARKYCLSQINIPSGSRILEVGCGTGAITSSIKSSIQTQIFGLDIQVKNALFAQKSDSESHFTCGDAFYLPYQSATFHVVYCHFLLMWIIDPIKVLLEMRRVVHSGGYILAFAEPDYGGRLDNPEDFSHIGQLQTQALQKKGADPYIGRRLSTLLVTVNLDEVHSGVLGGQWQAEPNLDSDLEFEWRVLKSDLVTQMTQIEWDKLIKKDIKARQMGVRILYIPTFYAWGKVRKATI
jgi:SAM-dependent methyltransferase